MNGTRKKGLSFVSSLRKAEVPYVDNMGVLGVAKSTEKV